MPRLRRSQWEDLLQRSARYTRSRKELVRLILREPASAIPLLFKIANEDLEENGSTLVEVVAACLDQAASADLMLLIYRSIPPKTVHFIGLATTLAEALLHLVRSVRPVDRSLEARFTHNLAVHLRDAQQLERATAMSSRAVQLLRQLVRGDSNHRQRLVLALGMWSKHLSESGDARGALRVSRQAVREAARLPGEPGRKMHAQTLSALGSCLVVVNRYPEAERLLREARETLTQLSEGAPLERFDVAHASLFLAGALHNQGRLDEAREFAEWTWKTLLKLVADDRGTYFEDFSTASDLLALIVATQGDHMRARLVHGEALRCIGQLARRNPQSFGHRYAWGLVNRASQSIHAMDYDDAVESSRLAFKNCRRADGLTDQIDHSLAATALFNLAVAQFGLHHWRLAREAALKSQVEFRKAPRNDPTRKELLPQLTGMLGQIRKAMSGSVSGQDVASFLSISPMISSQDSHRVKISLAS